MGSLKSRIERLEQLTARGNHHLAPEPPGCWYLFDDDPTRVFDKLGDAIRRAEANPDLQLPVPQGFPDGFPWAGAYRRLDAAGRETLLDFLSGALWADEDYVMKCVTPALRWTALPVPDDLFLALALLNATQSV
jgi:hypothetical protein